MRQPHGLAPARRPRRRRPPTGRCVRATAVALATLAALAGRSAPPRAASAQSPVVAAPPDAAWPMHPADPAPAALDLDAPRHSVRAGESAAAIAMAYGTTVAALRRANGLGPAAFVRAGQVLVVAGATRRPGDPPTAAAAGGDGAAGGPAGDGRGATDDIAAAPGRRIVVDLSEQRLVAYDGGRQAAAFTVSTGAADTPTPQGAFAIGQRLASQRMTGVGYDLPGVPYVQYFFDDYALHGAYWHQSFGVPVSHGCVNLSVADAAWLWSFAAIGTPVVVVP